MDEFPDPKEAEERFEEVREGVAAIFNQVGYKADHRLVNSDGAELGEQRNVIFVPVR